MPNGRGTLGPSQQRPPTARWPAATAGLAPSEFAFAVQDGKVQEVGHPYVVIQEWKIVLRGLDEHEVIFEWPDKTP